MLIIDFGKKEKIVKKIKFTFITLIWDIILIYIFKIIFVGYLLKFEIPICFTNEFSYQEKDF